MISDSRSADAQARARRLDTCSRRRAPGRRGHATTCARAAASSRRPRGRSSTRGSPRGWWSSRSRSTTCDDNVALIQRQILIAGLIALLVAIVSGYYAASALSRRVKRLERAAGEVAAGNFSEPIPVDSEDELGQLAQAFNEMQRRLARLDKARKEFIANASHELRTPIFSLGGFVELLQDEDLDEDTRAEFLTTMREQVDRLQKLTTDLLDLSRLDAGSLELRARAGAAARRWRRQVAGEFAAAAARKDAAIEVVDRDGRADVEAECDPQRVAQIVRVLLDNALAHTPDGTHVAIAGRARRDRRRRPDRRAAGHRRRPRDPPARPAARVRPLPHRRLGPRARGSGLAIARELAERMQGGSR